jgi:hypothetical protein
MKLQTVDLPSSGRFSRKLLLREDYLWHQPFVENLPKSGIQKSAASSTRSISLSMEKVGSTLLGINPPLQLRSV